MTVNNIPCKLLYTEYSKSSRSPTHGYHIIYIIALDYNIMNEHIKHCKLLIKLSSDERSLLSTLPKEIISIIKKFIMHKFASVYSWEKFMGSQKNKKSVNNIPESGDIALTHIRMMSAYLNSKFECNHHR